MYHPAMMNAITCESCCATTRAQHPFKTCVLLTEWFTIHFETQQNRRGTWKTMSSGVPTWQKLQRSRCRINYGNCLLRCCCILKELMFDDYASNFTTSYPKALHIDTERWRAS